MSPEEKKPMPSPVTPPVAAQPPPTPSWLQHSVRELIVIVIGILLSLWISNLFQNSKDDERAEIYLTRVHNELGEDLAQLEREYAQREGQLKSTNEMIAALNEEDPSGIRSTFFIGFQKLLWTTRFASKNATFRSMESTGDFRLIDNDSIVNGLLSLYGGSYESLEQNNTDLTKYRDNFLLPYVTKNISFRRAFNPSFYQAPMEIDNQEELYNHLIYESISMNSTVDSYARNIALVKETRALITRELDR